MATHRTHGRVARWCAALGGSRSGDYAGRACPESRRARENRALLTRIQAVHPEAREAYGAVTTWRVLRAQGVACGRHRVARLRRAHGIEARRRRRFRLAYTARTSAPAAPNLVDRQGHAPAPNRIWAGEITVIPTRQGWLSLAVVLDLSSRRIVGWAMSARPDSHLVLDALTMALTHRRPAPGVIYHSDQGIPSSSGVYQARLKTSGLVPSMSRKGNCYDNAVVENVFRSLKNEGTDHETFPDRDQAQMALFAYIELFYNRQRIHAPLDDQTPEPYERRRARA